MFSFNFINFIILFYLVFLIVAAFYAEKWVKDKNKKCIVANPYIYSLSMAVWCTSWTYYGSVGVAANNGMLYLTIYLGATLGIFLYPWLLKNMVLIKDKYRVTSVTDLIVVRYDKSTRLGIICALFILVGIIPYIAIQIKAILDTISIVVTGYKTNVSATSPMNHYIVVLCILTTIIFGLRKLDSTEKHPGLVFVLALESLVKLFAVIAVGLFCTYWLNDGYNSIFERLPSVVSTSYNFMGQTNINDFFTWCTYIVLSASAILFLPRQFQVAVVENYSIKHIKKAAWLFPLFLFLINLYVIPVAFSGLSEGFPIESADSFVLLLPLKHSQQLLTLFVFLGGFSAAIGMVIIETVAVSTIVSNQLVLPVITSFKNNSQITRYTLRIRWIIAALIIYSAYFYAWYVGSKYALVSMGLISFVAILQLAPAILFGLFWKKANKHGAMAGIVAGAMVWFYTLIIPAFAKSGFISGSILTDGPFGFSLLRPESLFNFIGLHFLTHSLIWSMLANLICLVFGSMLTDQTETEEKTVREFNELLSYKKLLPESAINYGDLEESIDLLAKKQLLTQALERYLTTDETLIAMNKIMDDLGLDQKEKINIYTLSLLNDAAEKYLAGLVGASVAYYTLDNARVFTGEEKKQLGDLYGQLLASMKVDPREMNLKLAELQRRQGQLEQDARSLELAMQKKNKELEDQKIVAYQASKLASLGEVAAGIAHEINNPLAIIGSSAQIMENLIAKENIDKEKLKSLTANIKQTVQRASRIVQGMRNIARQSDNDKFELVKVADMLEDSTSLCIERFKSRGVDLKIFADKKTMETLIEVNRTTISQSLINFLNNSFDAIISYPERWVELHLDIYQDHLRLKIIDSGMGIPQEIQDKIFQPFFTTKEVGKGTGLGLSLAVSFIKHHKGTISIDNNNPHTCFVIMLPLKHNH